MQEFQSMTLISWTFLWTNMQARCRVLQTPTSMVVILVDALLGASSLSGEYKFIILEKVFHYS